MSRVFPDITRARGEIDVSIRLIAEKIQARGSKLEEGTYIWNVSTIRRANLGPFQLANHQAEPSRGKGSFIVASHSFYCFQYATVSEKAGHFGPPPPPIRIAQSLSVMWFSLFAGLNARRNRCRWYDDSPIRAPLRDRPSRCLIYFLAEV